MFRDLYNKHAPLTFTFTTGSWSRSCAGHAMSHENLNWNRKCLTSNASSLLAACAHLACNETGMTGSVSDPRSCRSVSAKARATSGSSSAPPTLKSSPVSRHCNPATSVLYANSGLGMPDLLYPPHELWISSRCEQPVLEPSTPRVSEPIGAGGGERAQSRSGVPSPSHYS